MAEEQLPGGFSGVVVRVAEQQLPGGFVGVVVRVGDTVRRSPAPESARELLRLFERRGWAGAPRFRGVDAEGREVLDFLPGHVAWEPHQPADVRSDESLARVPVLVREFHDLTAGTALAGGEQVVCHNDLSPKNTVYRDDDSNGLRPVAFIDWDVAAPGQRVHDGAHVCWQYVGLGPELQDPVDAARRVRLVADAYGLARRGRLVDTVLWWQDRCWRGIEAEAAGGDPAKRALRDGGVPAGIRAASAWLREHRAVFDAALG